MKKLLCILALMLAVSIANSQEDQGGLSIDFGTDIVSRYIWRGINLSESPAIQPTLALSYKGFSLGTWGSFTVSREMLQEVDLFMTYESDFFSVTINDYYNPLDTLGYEGNYFDFSGSTTPHLLEGMITVNGPEIFPLSLTAATMFWGNDKDDNGKSLYSTYFELSYPFTVNDTETSFYLGLTPANGYYAEKFGLVNVGVSASREMKVNENFSIPLSASFMINPSSEKVYLVFGISF